MNKFTKAQHSTKLVKLKVRLTKYFIIKLIDLCKNDDHELNEWLDDLKWNKIKDTFKPFRSVFRDGNKDSGNKSYPKLEIYKITEVY